MSQEHSVVELADRIVDPRRAAIGYALVLIAFVAMVDPAAHAIYETLDLEPRAAEVLLDQADPESATVADSLTPMVIVLLDGMRVDESERSAPIEALRARGMSATVELDDGPTLSRPYYHALLTGVPPRGSGVRRNRPGQRQVFDALTDRVRAARGQVALIAEDLDWMAVLVGDDSDVDHHGADALGAPLDAILAQISAASGPALTIVHVLGVDESAHDHGIDSEEHREALSLADRVVAAVAEAAFGRAVIAVISDHGHIAVGGHGGDEPEVRFTPLVLVGDGVPSGRVARPLAVEELAPTFASWMGVMPPRSSITEAAPELAGPHAVNRERTARRATLLDAATNADRAARMRRWGWLGPLTALLVLMGLGATKRAFTTFDLGTLLAPALVAAGVGLIHVFVLDRPFTLSALDDATRQGHRLALMGAALAIVAIPASAAIARRRGGQPFAMHLRRAAGGVGWASLSFSAAVVASVGGTLGPWPPTAFGTYAPILALAAGGGASAAAAIVLISTAIKRSSKGASEAVDRGPAL